MRSLSLIFLSVILILTMGSCHQPQAEDYVPGTWGVLSYLEDGVDRTDYYALTYQAYQIRFDAKGRFTENYRLSGKEIQIDGTWNLTDNNTRLMMVDNDPNSQTKIRVYQVLKSITDSEMKLGIDLKVYDLKKM